MIDVEQRRRGELDLERASDRVGANIEVNR
jgi:hypothetical protein